MEHRDSDALKLQRRKRNRRQEDNYFRFWLIYVYPYKEEMESDDEYLVFIKNDSSKVHGSVCNEKSAGHCGNEIPQSGQMVAQRRRGTMLRL